MSSSLSQNTSAKSIVDHILATPLTMSVGEAIGLSRDVSQHFQDLIRVKGQALPFVKHVQGTPPAAAYMCLTSSPLITINLHCNDQPVKAVIDSGSTLNVVKASIAKSVIKMPIDTSHSMVMRDANGGTSKLIGLIQNVPLFCGAAQTWTNLFVSPNNDSGFNLLLGCPWAHGNLVSIVERDSGTYIIFGADSNHPLEMCAVDVHAASHSGTGLMATLEPESEMEEEPAAPYSSPPDPVTLDVLSDQFLDFPEAPDANPPSSENIFPILFSPPGSPLMPPGPVRYVSPAYISPTLSQSSSPMSALVREYNPLPPDPNLSADEALQRIIEQVETPGNTAAAEEHPVIARICARIHEQEGRSFLDRMLLTTSRLVPLSGLNLETCYALPAQEGVDEFGTPYQDYLILHACMVIVGEESIANPTGRIM